MASHGTFVWMCGFEYHRPKQPIGFAPRMDEFNFSAAFVAAEGWGTFSQQIKPARLDASLEVKWGRVRLRTITLWLPEGERAVGSQQYGIKTAFSQKSALSTP
jgi:non-lysosomal glucosylceramidase